MRRVIASLLFTLLAGTAWAGTPFFLDRNGTLWRATATHEGVVLTGQRDGNEIARDLFPFDFGLAGTSDTNLQVAADEATGKIVLVWQRNWSASASEIMLAVWTDGNWERIERLSEDLFAQPRNPSIQLSEFTGTGADPEYPDDPTRSVEVHDSHVHVVWWEGAGEDQRANYALLRLNADLQESDALLRRDLEEFSRLGLACQNQTPPEVLEHPLFAADAQRDRALLFFGSQRICLQHLVEVRFELEPLPPPDQGPGTITIQRRRSVPIFGIRRSFQMPRDLSMQDTRMILGGNLMPVAYRVTPEAVEYVTATESGWSPKRTLALGQGFGIDQAIALVENLAR